MKQEFMFIIFVLMLDEFETASKLVNLELSTLEKENRFISDFTSSEDNGTCKELFEAMNTKKTSNKISEVELPRVKCRQLEVGIPYKNAVTMFTHETYKYKDIPAQVRSCSCLILKKDADENSVAWNTDYTSILDEEMSQFYFVKSIMGDAYYITRSTTEKNWYIADYWVRESADDNTVSK